VTSALIGSADAVSAGEACLIQAPVSLLPALRDDKADTRLPHPGHNVRDKDY